MKAILIASFLLGGALDAHAQALGSASIEAIDEKAVDPLIKTLSTLKGPGTFSLSFNSPGGDYEPGIQLVNTMEAAKSKGIRFQCVADGLVASMAVVVWAQCDSRAAHVKSTFMIHSLYVEKAEGEMTPAVLRALADEVEAESDAMLRRISKILTVPFEVLKTKTDKGAIWFDVGRARDIGLVQEILP